MAHVDVCVCMCVCVCVCLCAGVWVREEEGEQDGGHDPRGGIHHVSVPVTGGDCKI